MAGDSCFWVTAVIDGGNVIPEPAGSRTGASLAGSVAGSFVITSATGGGVIGRGVSFCTAGAGFAAATRDGAGAGVGGGAGTASGCVLASATGGGAAGAGAAGVCLARFAATARVLGSFVKYRKPATPRPSTRSTVTTAVTVSSRE